MALPKGPIPNPRTTAEKKVKALWILRHYKGSYNARQPLRDEKGRPTPKATQAKRWGEPVPKTQTDRARLVRKGERLLASTK